MTLRIIKRAKAMQDLIDLAEYIARDDLDAAELNSLTATFLFLSKRPGAGAAREFFSAELVGLRMWPLRGFEKHLVFYRQLPNAIEIVRVIHATRDIPPLFEADDAP